MLFTYINLNIFIVYVLLFRNTLLVLILYLLEVGQQSLFIRQTWLYLNLKKFQIKQVKKILLLMGMP